MTYEAVKRLHQRKLMTGSLKFQLEACDQKDVMIAQESKDNLCSVLRNAQERRGCQVEY